MNSNSGSDLTDHHESRESNENSTISVQEHPLQDIFINSSENEIPSQLKTKKNWVKFDDEVAINENNNNNNNNTDGSDSISTAAEIGQKPMILNETIQEANIISNRPTTPTTTTTIQNKLSPPPPSSRSRKPQQQQQQQQQQAVTNAFNVISTNTTTPTTTTTASNRNSATVAPVQRTSITSDIAPAVLNTESTHVNLNVSSNLPKNNYVTNSSTHSTNAIILNQSTLSPPPLPQPPSTSSSTSPLNSTNVVGPINAIKSNSITIPVESTPPMRTIELSTGRIREGFANGDVIVTLLPANTKWPWITPAIFRPELVPEELMAQGLTLTVEEYVHAMETLVNDYRFTLYNICYKRILVCWIILAFSVLLTLLFSGLQGVALFSLGVGWLFLNAAAIFLCMWIKLRLARGLERCLARVNNQLIKHKILLILDDRGRISCHKVNLCFIYFDSTQCVNFLNEFLEHTERNGGSQIRAGWEKKLDLDINDIIIQGSNPLRLSRKQERGLQLYLRYGSRWGNEALRGLINVTPTEPGRHCSKYLCACQYIKHHLQCKPRGKLKILNFVYWIVASERYD